MSYLASRRRRLIAFFASALLFTFLLAAILVYPFLSSSRSIFSLAISPSVTTVPVGTLVPFTVTAYNARGASLGTAKTQLSILPDGSCSLLACFSIFPGFHVVTAQVASHSVRSVLTITPLPPLPKSSLVALTALRLLPATASLAPGAPLSYLVLGLDARGQVLGDLTAAASLLLTDGTCWPTQCTSLSPGRHTLVATYSTLPPASIDVTFAPSLPAPAVGNACLVGHWIATNITSVNAENPGSLTLTGYVGATLSIDLNGLALDNYDAATPAQGTYGAYSVSVTRRGSSTWRYAATATTLSFSLVAMGSTLSTTINHDTSTPVPVPALYDPASSAQVTYACSATQLQWTDIAASGQNTTTYTFRRAP